MTKNKIRDFWKYLYTNGSKKTVPVPVVSSATIYVFLIVPEVFKNGYFWPKMGHFWPKRKSEIFEKDFIWTEVKNCASSRSIIHFYVFLMEPEIFKSENSKKKGYFWSKMGQFWLKNKSGIFKDICIWMATKKCASTRSIIHFYVFLMVPEVFKSENSPKMGLFWPKVKSKIFKNIFIWTAAKNSASSRSIIQFWPREVFLFY